jgi:hypothetical protein
VNLANVYSNRTFATSDSVYRSNLLVALALQKSTLPFFSKSDDPRTWGVSHHNLGCAYTDLATLREDEQDSAVDLENAIYHLELSFEVREPVAILQYWVASCRSLGEAFWRMSKCKGIKNPAAFRQRGVEILEKAASKITPEDHPHQWDELQQQIANCSERARN